MYVEFTVSQTMEHFLGCHVNAFNHFRAVPEKIMVDNLKSAVIKRIVHMSEVLSTGYSPIVSFIFYSINEQSKFYKKRRMQDIKSN